jgi:hypothetical protein
MRWCSHICFILHVLLYPLFDNVLFTHADIFFQEERSRLLREIENGNDVLEAEGKSQGLFALMGKSIAKKWKSLTQDEMVKYTDAAKEDLKRYRREMDEYQYVLE